MSSFTRQLAISAPFASSVAIATLMGTAMLAGPLTAARADGATNAPIQLTQAAQPQHQTATAPVQTKGETVEQRITNLHARLKITPAQDAAWNNVAQAMRENAAAMDKLVAETRLTPPQNMNAKDDLVNYEKFAQAHVEGLKNLISSFDTLYDSMTPAQQKNADAVFQSFGRKNAAAHS